MMRGNGIDVLLDRRITTEWLVSQRANRIFFAGSLVQIAFAVAVVLVFFTGYRSIQDAIQQVAVQVALGVLGALTAVTGIFLMYGTRRYWRELDDFEMSRKRTWFWVMRLGVNFGSCAYYFFVYRPKTISSGEAVSLLQTADAAPKLDSFVVALHIAWLIFWMAMFSLFLYALDTSKMPFGTAALASATLSALFLIVATVAARWRQQYLRGKQIKRSDR